MNRDREAFFAKLAETVAPLQRLGAQLSGVEAHMAQVARRLNPRERNTTDGE